MENSKAKGCIVNPKNENNDTMKTFKMTGFDNFSTSNNFFHHANKNTQCR